MSFNFIENEENILKFWEKNKIFQKLRKKIQGKKPWSFLDGPITANNPMGVHHAWGRTYKDAFQRYRAMKGFDERFQNGFDCQGLWVEVEVEKELGFKNKKDIEDFGIGKFVNRCKERVKKYSGIQTKQSIRLGQWMDWDNSYYTMSEENNYAIWAFLKKCHEKGLLYKGHDVVPWCPRCGTAISQHEILTEEYKEITHKAVFVKFRVFGQGNNTYFLVWTTTPWTLLANVALAVNPDMDYVLVEENGNRLILLKDKLEVLNSPYNIVKEIKGKELEGMRYEGLFDNLPAVETSLSNYVHQVVLWDEINQEEGTGIVHIAPGCGQEDFQLSKDLGLPVIEATDNESRYLDFFGDFSGLFVNTEATRDKVFESIKENIYKIEDYTHRYPTCWRCKTELIFRLVDEWYIKMDSLRKPLIESVKKIKWIPSFGMEREIDWLNHMKDWLISKKRYWGLALPIFHCPRCGNIEVIGSKEELKEKAVEGWDKFDGHSPHRPWIDNVKIKCQKCGNLVSRIPDVGNPWLDAGIVPYSTLNYFSDRKYWEKWFPADFICESFPGQFKNWFYSILVMSQVLEQEPPFKTLLGYATVVDEKGEEMHKSKGNAIWFDEAIEEIGADVMRWMYAKQNPVYNLRFGYNNAKEIKRKLLTLINSYIFFETYAESNPDIKDWKPRFLLDKWIVSRANNLLLQVTEKLDKYNMAGASLAIESFFINDLSLWYIRRSRKRFQDPKEKQEAEKTLYYVLLLVTKIIAPITPFLAENFYQKLKDKEMPESVHLCDWPEVDKKMIDKNIEERMDEARKVVAIALSKRTEAGIKVRQPLNTLKISNEFASLLKDKEIIEIIKQEVNVKNISVSEKIELDTEITPELRKEGEKREVIRCIQLLRKKAGLTPRDIIKIYYSGQIGEIVKNILTEVKAESFEEISKQSNKLQTNIKIREKEAYLGVEKYVR